MRTLMIMMTLLGCSHRQATDWVYEYDRQMREALEMNDMPAYQFFREELIREKLRIYRETGQLSKPVH